MSKIKSPPEGSPQIIPYLYYEDAGGNRQYTASDPGGQHWTFAQPVEKTADDR